MLVKSHQMAISKVLIIKTCDDNVDVLTNCRVRICGSKHDNLKNPGKNKHLLNQIGISDILIELNWGFTLPKTMSITE